MSNDYPEAPAFLLPEFKNRSKKATKLEQNVSNEEAIFEVSVPDEKVFSISKSNQINKSNKSKQKEKIGKKPNQIELSEFIKESVQITIEPIKWIDGPDETITAKVKGYELKYSPVTGEINISAADYHPGILTLNIKNFSKLSSAKTKQNK